MLMPILGSCIMIARGLASWLSITLGSRLPRVLCVSRSRLDSAYGVESWSISAYGGATVINGGCQVGIDRLLLPRLVSR